MKWRFLLCRNDNCKFWNLVWWLTRVHLTEYSNIEIPIVTGRMESRRSSLRLPMRWNDWMNIVFTALHVVQNYKTAIVKCIRGYFSKWWNSHCNVVISPIEHIYERFSCGILCRTTKSSFYVFPYHFVAPTSEVSPRW